MPSAWESELSRYTVGENSIWTPNSEPKPEERINGFYRALDQSTQTIVGYPSELIQVIEALHRVGNKDVQLVALPPRGAHEQRNLDYAIEKGLVAAGTALKGVRSTQYGREDLALHLPSEL